MTSGDLLALLRAELDDLADPYLWSDDELYSYIDDAQKMFCRKTDGIPDATTVAVTQFPVAIGDSYHPLHPSILKIRAVSRADTGREVEVLNYEDLAPRGLYYQAGVTGPVYHLVIGEQMHTARTFPVSNEVVTLNLLVFRLPLYPIVDDQPFEIDDAHLLHLMSWCKRMAYLKQDAETFDKRASLDNEERFYAYCTEVMAEEQKKAHKTRVVQYGGLGIRGSMGRGYRSDNYYNSRNGW